jgi:DeoR/GlpR family transcriptional regulator of sugar metabolism
VTVRDIGGARKLPKLRHERIVHEVKLRGAARVADLSGLLGVSDMTVRRDLDVLDEAGLVLKVHGGATAVVDHTSNEPGFVAKSLRNIAEKSAIAEAAASMVHPGSAIGISAGTTTWRMAGHLLDIADLTVVTNSVRVSEVFNRSARSDRTLILTGGVRTPSDALVGPIAVAALERLHVDTLFIGVHGMSTRAGFSTPNLLEAEANRSFIRAASTSVVLADHTKWGLAGLSSFADLSEADVLITDDELDIDAVELLASHIDRVHRVASLAPDVDNDHSTASARVIADSAYSATSRTAD